MSEEFHIGNCPVCNQGRQIVRIEEGTNQVFVRCEECTLEWDDPDTAVISSEGKLQRFSRSRLATGEDLQNHPRVNHVLNLKQD